MPLKRCKLAAVPKRSRSDPRLASKRGASTGPAPEQAGEEVMIFMAFESSGDLSSIFLEELELAADELHAQSVAFRLRGLIGCSRSMPTRASGCSWRSRRSQWCSASGEVPMVCRSV